MGHPSKFLVVDDEPQILDLLTEFLKSQGHSIRVAGNGEQALDLLQQESFDAVLTDLKMPRLGGLELLQVIKLAYPVLPVIIITGYPSFEDAVEAMRKGAADFITKPLRLDELKLALSKVTKPCKPVHLEDARSYESSPASPAVLSPLHGKMKELSALYSISEAFQAITDTESIFQRLVQVARELVGAQSASFMILDRETYRTPLKTVHAVDDIEARGERHLQPPLDDHMLGRVVRERKPLLYHYDKPVVLVPVLIKNELLGVLSAWGKGGMVSFTEDEVLLLLTLCRKASLSIENQLLYEGLYQNMIETLKALVTTLESRDPYTRAHSQRVSHYAKALAAKMGCNQEEQDISRSLDFCMISARWGSVMQFYLRQGL